MAMAEKENRSTKKARDDAQEKVAAVAAAFARLAASKDGKVVLSYLDSVFYHRILGAHSRTKDDILQRTGQHDLMVHVHGMIEAGQKLAYGPAIMTDKGVLGDD
jgi:hypothetical protein